MAWRDGSGEHLLPLEVTPYTETGDRTRLAVGRDFTVSQDGRSLYADAFGYLLQFDLATGKLVADLGHFGTLTNPRLSPDGEHIVVQVPTAGSRTILMRADGSGKLTLLEGTSQAGVSYGPPVWFGNESVLMLVEEQGAETSVHRVLQFNAPDWQATEYLPLRGVYSVTTPRLSATTDGRRVFVERCLTLSDCALVEYSPGGPRGEVVLSPPLESGAHAVLSPDGRHVAFGGTELTIYDLTTRRLVRTITGATTDDRERSVYPVEWIAGEID